MGSQKDRAVRSLPSTLMRIANSAGCPLYEPHVSVLMPRWLWKIAIWEANIRLQKIPLNETAIASPTLTADSMIQPANTDRGPRRSMTLSTNDLNDRPTQSSRSRCHVGNTRRRVPTLVDTHHSTHCCLVDTNRYRHDTAPELSEGSTLSLSARSKERIGEFVLRGSPRNTSLTVSYILRTTASMNGASVA
ncbi:hypothetical protein P3T25_002910 [Paraburkholderia sp. GAS32]